MDNKIEFQATLTDKDWMAYRSQLVWRNTRILLAVALLNYVLVILMFIFLKDIPEILIYTSAIIDALLPLLILFFGWRAYRKTTRDYDSALNNLHYTIAGRTVSAKGDEYNDSFDLTDITIKKQIILLWCTSTRAHIVPRRCLNEQQFEQLKQLLSNDK